MALDVSFDIRSDTPKGLDPDTYSPTLKLYHQLFWQKPLPSGEIFTLVPQGRRAYLVNDGIVGRLPMASDSIMVSHSGKLAPLYEQMPDEANKRWHRVGSTIGGFMLFPGAQIDRLQTINQTRGTSALISDRFDLTLECIRRFYLWKGEPSPLREVIARYYGFFLLFRDFAGFVEFFLLQDLVDDGGQIRLFHPFTEFTQPALPGTLDAYVAYRDAQLAFLALRNERIESWWLEHHDEQLARMGETR